MMLLFFFLFVLFLVIIAIFIIALHLGFRAPRIQESKTPVDFAINNYQELHIPTVSGKFLFGWLLPVEGSNETLVILHGWGGNAELMLPIAKPFYKAGINILLIDSRGHGKSDSDSFSSLPRFAEDVGKAIDWLKREHPERTKKIALLGHSVGAGAVLMEASKRNDIKAVISISAFAHPEWMMKRYLTRLHLPSFLLALILRYVEWVIGHSFASFAPMSSVCKITGPVLIVHGKKDTTVPIEDAYAIMLKCPEPHIEIFEVDDAGHDSVDKIEEHADQLIGFLKKAKFDVNI